jgi:Protein of unknown function (DUF2726)
VSLDGQGSVVNWKTRAELIVGAPLAEAPWPVEAKRLLTEREHSLYRSLLSLYPNHQVFIQVALSQLVDVPEDHPERQSIRNRFAQLVADFVLCRADLSVVAVIELDDRSHERSDRQAADARKNKALADAGIRLVRIPAGRLPSEQYLRTLIDPDGKGGRIYPEQPVLTLAEDIYAPASSYDSDEVSTVSREFKRIALKAVFAVVFGLCGWFLYINVLPNVLKHAFAPLAKPQVRTVVVPPKKTLLTPRQNASAPAVSQPSAEELAERKKGQSQEALSLHKQRNLAWTAFYTAPASCEHPADWSAQVECGNLYMRAKKVFDEKWEAEHPSSQGNGAEVVLDNGSAGRPRK